MKVKWLAVVVFLAALAGSGCKDEKPKEKAPADVNLQPLPPPASPGGTPNQAPKGGPPPKTTAPGAGTGIQ